MGATITRVTAGPGDLLYVEGFDPDVVDDAGNPRQLVAQGWVSAMENHYDADVYDEDGNRRADAKPRDMTEDERHAYWQQLLDDFAGVQRTPATTVLFESAETAATLARIADTPPAPTPKG